MMLLNLLTQLSTAEQGTKQVSKQKHEDFSNHHLIRMLALSTFSCMNFTHKFSSLLLNQFNQERKLEILYILKEYLSVHLSISNYF